MLESPTEDFAAAYRPLVDPRLTIYMKFAPLVPCGSRERFLRARLRAAGHAYRKAARALGISHRSVQRLAGS
jgi:hypothetical protein